jgi:hypothetical protein
MHRCAGFLTNISPRCSLAALAAVLTTQSLSAQSMSLDQLLDRMGTYLIEYETELSSVVADERFEQNIYPLGAGSRTQATTLESEVAFIRLPGGAEWLGFRDVRRVNFKPLTQSGPSVSDVLTSAAGDMTKARAIANASAKYNLGLPRTINVPTAPLDIIHPAHRAAHRYELAGHETIRGTRTMVVVFTEVTRPTLVREPNGTDLISSGRIWIDPESGVVWRVEWIYQAEKRHPRAPAPPRLRVDFERHQELGFMVPRLMTEQFSTPSRTRGEGRATYRNFRRFGTTARIVPQP